MRVCVWLGCLCLLVCACVNLELMVFAIRKNIIYLFVISVSVDFVFEVIKICFFFNNFRFFFFSYKYKLWLAICCFIHSNNGWLAVSFFLIRAILFPYTWWCLLRSTCWNIYSFINIILFSFRLINNYMFMQAKNKKRQFYDTLNVSTVKPCLSQLTDFWISPSELWEK